VTPTPTRVSVVICAYTEERWEDLAAAIQSVRAQVDLDVETILVIDHNPALFTRARAELQVDAIVENDGRRGLSDARNRGVRVATAPIVAFLDDDARAMPGWLSALVGAYGDERVIGVGGSATPAWPSSGRPGWFPDEFDWVVGCSYRGQPTRTATVRNFLGCNMSFRRTLFDEIGGFDTAVGRVGTRPVGGEETEFCIRASRAMAGSLLVYEPSARVMHTVPHGRARWTYFRSRCFSEGISKAVVSRLAGAGDGLASERRYASVVLPRGVIRNLAHTVRSRDADGARRAGAIVAGLAITTAGYASGVIAGRLRGAAG
jgi:glycosyltransferase involved in cell wall biosynthesis